MSRTVFVNPSFENPRRRRRKKSKRRSRGRRSSYRRRSRGRKQSYRGTITIRRNAGISPFVQNPLILSNPRKRRSRRRNPLAIPSVKGILDALMSSGGGAAIALTVNTVGTSKISNNWGRRAAQAAAAGVGSAVLGKYAGNNMGCAFGGAMMVPLLQDLAADLLGIGVAAGVTAKEADIDALAADLEDVLDEMSPGDAADYGDDEEYAW